MEVDVLEAFCPMHWPMRTQIQHRRVRFIILIELDSEKPAKFVINKKYFDYFQYELHVRKEK